jgi:translocation and assembly module TamB
MRRGGIIAGVVFLVIGGALAFLTHRLLYTQEGLDFTLRQLDRIPGTRIVVTGARGTLAGPLAVERVVVDHEAVHIDARGLHVVSRLRALVIGRIQLDELAVRQIAVRLKPRPDQPETEPHFLPAAVRIEAPDFRINDIDVTLQDGRRIAVRAATGALVVTRWRLDLDPVEVASDAGHVGGSLALRATRPLGLRTNLAGEWRLPDDAYAYRFRLETRGNLDRLGATVTLEAPAQLSFDGTLLDLTAQPRAKGVFRMTEFDGAPWVPAGRLPQLTGSITLAAGTRSLGLDGTLTTPLLEAQQVRVQGAGRWNDAKLEIASFRTWLPRLGMELNVSGTVELPPRDAPEGTLPLVELEGDWTALRWPLTGAEDSVVASPQGVFTLQGSLPYEFRTRAEVTGAAIPATSFDASGVIRKESVTLDAFDGYALRGRIRGSGRLAWTGSQAWRFEMNAKSLAIGELRPEVEGRVDVAGTIEGTGLTPDAPWTARLASLSGTMYGVPLTGHGEIAHRAGTFELRRVRIANGSSHVDINGSAGAAALDLTWDANLRTLAVVRRGMSGQLVSSGRARGTLSKPQVTGNARVTQFAYEGLEIGNVDLEADVDASDHRRSRIVLDARDLATPALDLATLSARVDGFMSEHAIAIDVTSPGNLERRITEFQGEVRADGVLDLDRKEWHGNLMTASVDFPDGQAKLIQPAALSLSPEFQRVAPLCLRTADDARLCVEGEHRARPLSWRVIYSAQDWPLQRLLRRLLGWREFDGRLQASGWAERAPGADWVGGTTLLLDDPSFDIPRNKFRTERIHLGSGRVDVFADPDAIRAALRLEVDESTQLEGDASMARVAGDPLASPLRGRISGTSEAIRVLPLVVPEIDRAAGKLDGQVTLGGTLGEPEFNGDFQLREGRLELYRTNLIVSDLAADGRFVGDQLTFAATGATARGKLTVAGDFSWPEGVMTGAMRLQGDQLLVADTPDFRILASPDIVLRSGVDGYEVKGEVKIPSARISPRELSSTVNTSPDERIVGLEDVDETGPSTTDRIVSSVRVVLGDAVRVDSYGLKARLEGGITVSTAPADVPRGNGVIRIVDGQYKAFGQDVRISRGTLSYDNTPLAEPLLEITAERTIKDDNVVVGVNVRGTLDQPYITLTSTPAMSNNEVLSYLLSGRSLDTLQSGEAANVNLAADNLAISGGGLLLGNLGSRLGLDEIRMERTGDDDTSVVLGKALSTRLFVSYGISIAEAINTIKLRYTLNERWAVKAEAGLEQSADVEYKIER